MVPLHPSNLDIFAATLKLENGECPYLHCGLYEEDSASRINLLAAQQAMAERIARLTGEFPAHNVLLQQGSVMHLDQLQLLQGARTHLKQGGVLVWCSEFILDNGETTREPLSRLHSFERLAKRLGFEMVRRLDLSAAVRPSWSAMERLLKKHDQTLQAVLSVDSQRLLDLREFLQQADDRFRRGRQGYFVFVLRVAGQPDIDYGDIHSFSPAEIGDVFEKSFGHGFNPALWQWKYGNGRGRAVVARKAGQVVSHYGGAPRDVLYFGKPALAIQICDVMVLPEERGHYGRDSLFFNTAATFLEREIGYTVEHLLGFGFPNLKAMHIATRLGLYEKTDDFIELFYPRPQTSQPADWSVSPASDVGQQGPWLERLWHTMAADFEDGILGLRDRAYIDYRYLQHPVGAYRFHWIHAPGESWPRALVILKSHQQGYLLMDIIAAVANMKPALAAIIAACADDAGCDGLRCWITRGWQQALLLEGAEVRDLRIEIPCHRWSPGPPAEVLYGKWWLTAGDMDFQ
ncbi:MAG: hypothetical protein RLZZ385_1106 [Pseudomonadota bacterium]|jgi:hypothetical protein